MFEQKYTEILFNVNIDHFRCMITLIPTKTMKKRPEFLHFQNKYMFFFFSLER